MCEQPGAVFCFSSSTTYIIAAKYELSLVFAHVLSIDFCTRVIDKFSPLREQPTCALVNQNSNQDAWAFLTLRRLKANSIHAAARHTWTQMPPRYIVHKVVLYLIHFPALFISLWSLCHFDLGRSRHGWWLFVQYPTNSPYIYNNQRMWLWQIRTC